MSEKESVARVVSNVFWGNRLAALPHFPGKENVCFSSLWPDKKTFLEMYQLCEGEDTIHHLVKLLLASKSLIQFEALISERLLSWDHKFADDVTLTHLLCALNPNDSSQLFLNYMPDNNVWIARDRLGRDPLTVCFSSESRKKLRKGIKYLNTKQFNKSNPKALSELTKEAKENLLKLACDPEGLYEFVVLLQSYIIDIDNDRDNDGNTFVHKIMEGGLACLPHLLYLVKTYNANVDLPNNNGLTPSAVAANCGHERLVEVMVCVFGVSVNSPVNKSNWTLLHCAAANNQPDLIRMLLERGGDANLEDITHCLPCFIAQKHGNIECCQILMHHINERNEMLAQQASQGLLLVDFMSTSDMCLITKDGFTLLMKAVLGNKPATVRAIANAPNCPKDFRQMKLPEIEADCVGLSKVPDHVTQTLKTAVAIAAENGYTECLRILLDCGCNPTIEDYSRMLPIHHAVSGGHKDCVKLIVSQRNGLTGLKLATSLAFSIERTDILNILNEAMSRRQKDIVNPKLFEVAATGDEEALYSLLEDGDDVNPINELSEWPLFNAVRFGHTGVVKMLYEHGGMVVYHNRLNLSTPLHQAATGGHVEVMKFLLKFARSASDADFDDTYLNINEKNAMGSTPLELACSLGHMAIVRLLIDHRAVTTLPDSSNRLLSCRAFGGIQFLLESARKEQMDKIVRALKEQMNLKDFIPLWKGPSDFNLRDSHGNTVLMIAARHSKPDVVEFLLQSARHFTPDMRITWNPPKAPPTKRTNRRPRLTNRGYNSSFEDSYTSDTGYANHYMKLKNNVGNRERPMSGAGVYKAGSNKELQFIQSYEQQKQVHHYYNRVEEETSDDELSTSEGEEIRLTNPISNDYYSMMVDVATVDINVTPGPCTLSGVVCLVNIRDGKSALHVAVEANQHRLIPLILMADPMVANIQDKQGRSALHLACQLNHNKCVSALFSCRGIPINTTLRDVSNSLAEDLVIKPSLKRTVIKYREKLFKEAPPPATRPLPPIPIKEPSPRRRQRQTTPNRSRYVNYPIYHNGSQYGNGYATDSPYYNTPRRHTNASEYTPVDRRPNDYGPMDRRPNDYGPMDRRPNDYGPMDRRPNDYGPMDRHPNDYGPRHAGLTMEEDMISPSLTYRANSDLSVDNGYSSTGMTHFRDEDDDIPQPLVPLNQPQSVCSTDSMSRRMNELRRITGSYDEQN